MKIAFRKARLRSDSLERLVQINSIIEDYKQQGYKLTLRQLYYRLVSKNIIGSRVSEYDKLSRERNKRSTLSQFDRGQLRH